MGGQGIKLQKLNIRKHKETSIKVEGEEALRASYGASGVPSGEKVPDEGGQGRSALIN